MPDSDEPGAKINTTLVHNIPPRI